jgi:hypothetical protein
VVESMGGVSILVGRGGVGDIVGSDRSSDVGYTVSIPSWRRCGALCASDTSRRSGLSVSTSDWTGVGEFMMADSDLVERYTSGT